MAAVQRAERCAASTGTVVRLADRGGKQRAEGVRRDHPSKCAPNPEESTTSGTAGSEKPMWPPSAILTRKEKSAEHGELLAHVCRYVTQSLQRTT